MSAETYLSVGVIVAMILVAFPALWVVWWLLADLAGNTHVAPSSRAMEQRRHRVA